MPATTSRAAPPLGTTRCGIGSSPWKRRARGELEAEEEGAVDEWEEEGAVDVGVSDSEEELDQVLRQPGLIEQLADVVTQRASCVTEL